MDITLRPTDSIKPYEHNPRVNDGAVDAVAASLKEFGFRQPIVVDVQDVIVVGHTRWKAARKLGLAMVPVHVATDLTPAQAKAYRIADNATNELAEWDKLLLPIELQALQQMDVDLGLLGFDPSELDRLLVGDGKDGLTDPDDVPPVPAEPVTRVGDLWTLGDHRVLCGDATVASDVERLLDGAVPFLMVTDPPYGVEYDPAWRHRSGLNDSARTGKVQNDDRVDWTDAYRLFPGHVAYVWHAGVHASEVSVNLQAAGFGVRAQIIWRKPRFVIGRGAYHWGHEPCWYAVRDGGSAKWCGDRSQSTVWDIAQRDDTGETVHGTQKPVECMARPIRNHGSRDDAVYDPFLGSGTTVMAAEQLGRRCYGIEISPGYVDVTVQRWQAFTGRKATRVDANGKVAGGMTDSTPAFAGVVEGVG